ncbi:MAG: hypothetical protein HOP18_04180, partial [Deltaproteobacteria bacterium]|nr:hypothetical protein [Deltaproteobacteria bacterium]
PAQVEKSLSLRDPQLVGTAEEIQGRVKALAAVGVRHFILSLTPPYDRAMMKRFATEVMPALRKG